jgi:hypothetical protein
VGAALELWFDDSKVPLIPATGARARVYTGFYCNSARL